MTEFLVKCTMKVKHEWYTNYYEIESSSAAFAEADAINKFAEWMDTLTYAEVRRHVLTEIYQKVST